jgi:SAM-dependent methyltransferase
MNLDNFDRNLDEAKVVRFGLFEFVDSFLDEEYADLIIINNALDHCIDPYRSIIKCFKVLKVGGVLRLCHRRAEAVYEGWMGLHKWNVDYNDSDEFILWNKDNCINISQKLKDFANVRVVHSDYETDAWETFITVEIEKRDEACIDEFEYEQDAKELGFLLDLLMKKYADSYLEQIQ